MTATASARCASDGWVTEGRAISWYDRTWADRAHNAAGDTRTAAQALGAWSADPDQTAVVWYDRVSVDDWNVVVNTCQHAIVDDPGAPELDDPDRPDRPDRPGGGGGGGGGGGDRTWDVDGDGHGDFATETEARAYALQVFHDDPDAYVPIRPGIIDCVVCNGPDRAGWVDNQAESDDPFVPQSRPRPRPGGVLANFAEDVSEAVETTAEFFTNLFRPGNNNNNNNNNDDADDDDNHDQARPRPRPRPGCRIFCRRDT